MAKSVAVGGQLELGSGPYRGVYTAPDPGESRQSRLIDAVNMLIPDPANLSAIVARHGFVGLTFQLAGAGQCVWPHRRLDGTLDLFMFAGGHMYRWDGASGFVDITPDNIEIDASNPVFCVSFNGELVVSDEVNKPWVYNAESGVAEIIEADDDHNPWNTKGGPTIRAGKVFFIVQGRGGFLATEDGDIIITEGGDTLANELLSGFQNTVFWSEELDVRIGYRQGDYDNSWELSQSSSELLGALVGTESRLVFLRNKGIGDITGEVSEDFKAQSTKDGIDATLGTNAPAATLQLKDAIWSVSLDGKPFRIIVGGDKEELDMPLRREVESHFGTARNQSDVVANARIGYHESYNLVLYTIWDRQTIYAFDATSGAYVGSWAVGAGIYIDAMGSMLDNQNRSTFVIIGTRTDVYSSETQGVVWRQKHPDDDKEWLDQPDESEATYLGLDRAIESHWLTHGGAALYRALDVMAELIGSPTRHAVGLEYVVPASGKSSRLVARSSAIVGEFTDMDSISIARWSLGRNAQGSGIRIRLSATHSDNVRWGVHNFLVHATVTKSRPGSK